MEKYYVTTAIAYVNSAPHIGFALELLYSDVLARFHRIQSQEVFFLTGTDEHGSKIARAAEKAGETPQVFTDRISASFSLLADTLNVTNTGFIRTTEPRHALVAQELWKRADAAGKIYKKKYQGLYCVGCEAFKKEKDLVDGKCPDHHTVPELLEEENYFFKLTDYRDALLAYYQSHPEFVVPQTRFNEVLELVQEGLEDVSISRSTKLLNWGVPVPGDTSQVMYVWFDALANYLTGIGFPSHEYAKWWPADVHVIGKEISRFHAVLWPAMLMASGLELPKKIAVHGHISVDGRKMSKSLGNVIDPFALAAEWGVEPMRYFLLREIPFTSDGDYSEARLKERYAGDLANGVGNLVARVLAMVEKYEGGKIPEVAPAHIMPEWRTYEEHIAAFQFHLALADVWDVIASADKLIDEKKPWALAKTDAAELSKVLYVLTETIRHIALMLWPFMPQTSEKILGQLGFAWALGKEPLVELQKWGLLAPGTAVSRGEPLFPRKEVR